MGRDIDTLIVFSCDQGYFPLAKGLVLSILERGPLADGIGLGFIDIGCDDAALTWLRERGVRVRTPGCDVMGELSHPRFGYRRSQVCRPFLPKLFRGITTFVWIDSDAWVQDVRVLKYLREASEKDPDDLFITPECHYTYTHVNESYCERHKEMYSYYEPVFGPDVARSMCELITLNSGLFAMRAHNPLWLEWETEVSRIYLQDSSTYAPMVLHMAEQTALNVVARRSGRITLLDPLYNYVGLWTLPFRDTDGIVRVAMPPHVPIGILHLAGGWRRYGKNYFENGLLYRSGEYLDRADTAILFGGESTAEVR
jgi:hypothetical protein